MNMPEAFIQVRLFVPDAYWPAIGYEGEARYVATYYGAGDEAYYEDGRIGGTGDWQAYRLLLDYLPNHARLGERRWWLGSSEEAATHWLVCDRENGRCWLASVNDAAYFLSQQWPPQPQIQLIEAGWDELEAQIKAAFADTPRPTHEQIRQAMAEQAARVAALRAALNMN
jgi:hypothetical protein